jgi:hypothetical protein
LYTENGFWGVWLLVGVPDRAVCGASMSDNYRAPAVSDTIERSADGDHTPSAPSRFFCQTDWLAFWLTSIVMLGVYLFTLIPEVTLGFTGLFAVGGMYQGVPDPPGFPVFTLYSWPFIELLPWSNIAWRVAVASAFAGALACGVLSLLVSRGGAHAQETGASRRLKAKEDCLQVACGLVAGWVSVSTSVRRNAISGVPFFSPCCLRDASP